jgi:uncharacterized repeat protein (TIGR03803 family)
MRVSASTLVAVFLSAAVLAACGSSDNGLSSSMPLSVAPRIGAPVSQSPAEVTAERTHVRPAYSVLYSFQGGNDGEYPHAGLINVNGTLYSTTEFGGTGRCKNFRHRSTCGTAFAITTSGGETVLYRFTRVTGTLPVAELLDVKGTLYGTTADGGGYGGGTVFAITTSGTETVRYSFGGVSEDGRNPVAGLISVKGTLYGTTCCGGLPSHNGGTVFAISPAGAETVIHRFGASGDGLVPLAGLTNVNGTLYGTTQYGGASTCNCGTVFKITKSGAESVLYSFRGSPDGLQPGAGLIYLKGILYGTTTGGGKYCHSSGGCGTVFSITTSGKEKVLHSFGGSGDGAGPVAALLNVNGTLYGTTIAGGASNSGAVFAVTKSGKETVLYSFGSYSGDGGLPAAGLTNANGTLYGTTIYGGAHGYGTVFSLSP